MNIPDDFKWVTESEDYLNSLSFEDKKEFLKKNEINIRQSIGEAIPTIIIEKIARNIKDALNGQEVKTNHQRLQFATQRRSAFVYQEKS